MGGGERFRGQGRDLGGREVNTRCHGPVLGQGWDVRNRKTCVCGGGGGGGGGLLCMGGGRAA